MKRLLLLLPMLSAMCWGQAGRYDSHIWSASSSTPGGASAPLVTQPYAQITVCNSGNGNGVCTNTVPIFSDLGMTIPLSNPMTADSLGQYGFFLTPGQYVTSIQDQAGNYIQDFPIAVPEVPYPSNVVVADQYPGADLGAKLLAAQTAELALGITSGVIEVNTAATLNSTPVLADGWTYKVNAPIDVLSGAYLKLGSNSSIVCSAGALVTLEGSPGFLAIADSKQHVGVSGCHVYNQAHNGYVLSTTAASVGAADLTIDTVITDGANLISTAGTLNQRITVTKSTAVNSTTVAAVLLVNTIGAVVSNNHINADVHGLQYSGGDANGGYTGPSADTLTGNITFTGNECKGVLGACGWGSMGFNVTMTGNTSIGSGDIAYDLEGTIHSLIGHNVCDGTGGNECAAMFFGGLDNRIADNVFFRNDNGVLIILKYSFGNFGPRNRNVAITDNTLSCRIASTLCTAFYSEGDADLTFSRNKIHNGTYNSVGYTANRTIEENEMVFDFIPSTSFTAFNFSDNMLGESWLRFNHNTVGCSIYQTGYYPQFSTGSAGVYARYVDFNFSDYFEFNGNKLTCFPTAIWTNNGGGNVGPTAYPHMNTFIGQLTGNTLDHGVILHTTMPITISDPNCGTACGTGAYIEDNYHKYPTNYLFDGTLAP